MIDAIDSCRTKHQIHLWAYVLMPEHVHLLFWPTRGDYSIGRILSALKQPVSKRALLFIKRHAPAFLPQMEEQRLDGTVRHHFWQRGGGYDRNLTEPTAIWSKIDYIHANPVRRGLCERAMDWRWSSAGEHETPGSGPLAIDRESLPRTADG